MEVLDSLYCLYEKTVPKVNWTTVVCAIIKVDDKYLCCQRSEEMKLPLQWEFPGGKREQDESLSSALAREIYEELNLNVEVGEIIETSYYRPKRIKLIALECRVINLIDLTLNEHKAIRWLSIDKLHTLNWARADLPILKKLTNN